MDMVRASERHRGTALLIAIGMLMLMAIVAVSFLVSTRVDHASVGQHQTNTQADLLMEGLMQATRARLVAGDPTVADAPSTDTWLASRVPVTVNPEAPFDGNPSNDAGRNLAQWTVISAPTLGESIFDSPVLTPGMLSMRFAERFGLQPTIVKRGGTSWPALRSSGQAYVAADADGDGVADAGLFRLPVGQLNGVTYFGAIRVIDNNAAINLNTALSRDEDFVGDGKSLPMASNVNAGAFTSHVGLAELLRTESAGSVKEVEALNQYRWAMPSTPVRPQGIDGPVYDDTRLADGDLGWRTDDLGKFAEFQFSTVGDFLQSQVGRRTASPGITNVDPRPQKARQLLTEGLAISSRFTLGQADSAADRLSATIASSIRFGPGGKLPGTPIRTQPYAVQSSTDGIDTWFKTHFDIRAEDPADASTWMCRRTLLTATNGTCEQSHANAMPPACLYSTTESAWAGRRVDAYPPVFVPVDGQSPVPTVPMAVASAGTRFPGVDPRVSMTTGRFEELFYAYFKVMARPGFTGRGDDAGTPFSGLFLKARSSRANVQFDSAEGIYASAGSYYTDPYIGTRFLSATPIHPLESGARNEPAGLGSIVNGKVSSALQPVVEQHPLRMFRSPLRPPPAMDGTSPPHDAIWTAATPRLPADQVLILRAAIAAANLEALRDSSHCPTAVDPANGQNARTTPHRIPLTAMLNEAPVQVVATVFGLRRQPFIAEVYANTLAGVSGAMAPAPPGIGVPNPKGYVAIKLYNPTAVPISLQYCRLVGLNRSRTRPYDVTDVDGYPAMRVRPLVTLTAANAATTSQIDLGTAVSNVQGAIYPPYVVPPRGTLVLENLPGFVSTSAATAMEDATYRPNSSGLVSEDGTNAGPFTPKDFLTQNFAYVPGLSRVVWDRDLILMRPANCQPPSPDGNPVNTLVYIPADPDATSPSGIAGMVPLDSYDFTGLAPLHDATYTPVRNRAEIWHYARTLPSARTSDWQFVYPGRYDANQSVPRSSDEWPGPRQQGTLRAVGSDGKFGWDPRLTSDKDPLAQWPRPGLVVYMGEPSATGMAATYPDGFTIRPNAEGWPGDQPLNDYTTPDAAGRRTPNVFPFGGFRRTGDVLQVPFIGSYTIQTEDDAADGVDRFLELTPVTMDAIFAEDTDPSDNEQPGDDGTRPREQIGRFVPLHDALAESTDTTRYDDFAGDDRLARYGFARSLFDHLTFSSPHDDYVPNYPCQPMWRPGISYSVGDVVQYGQHLFVCRTAHTAGESEAASKAAPDWLDAGTAARPPAMPFPTPPQATQNWQPLPRYALANGHAPAGSRSDLYSDAPGNPRPYDFDPSNDQNEVGHPTPGLINLNTAPEKVLAMLPWSPNDPSSPTGDSLTFDFGTSPPTVTAGGDGMDDNAQIAHAILLYRDGGEAGSAFESIWDLYRVPGMQAAQEALSRNDPAHPSNRPDFEQQSILLNRVSTLITTRSDSFTLYAVLQGWRDAGTENAQLVVQRRAATIVSRERSTDGEWVTKTISRIPTH